MICHDAESLRLMSALGHSATYAGHALMSEKSPEADIELSCVKHGAVFLNRRSLLWNAGLPAP